MIEIFIYLIRCALTALFTWLAIRMIGRRSIAQMTSYDFAAILILANVAAEPLVYKVSSKAFIGTMAIALVSMGIGWLSLRKRFYNVDIKPSIIVLNGKVLRDELKKNRINLPFLFSMLREKGYTNVADVEFAIIEPDGHLSVIPKSQIRPVQPRDLKIATEYEGLALPLIMDGEIQYNNLKYAKLTTDWLYRELAQAGAAQPEEVFLAELNTAGELYVDRYQDQMVEQPDLV